MISGIKRWGAKLRLLICPASFCNVCVFVFDRRKGVFISRLSSRPLGPHIGWREVRPTYCTVPDLSPRMKVEPAAPIVQYTKLEPSCSSLRTGEEGGKGKVWGKLTAASRYVDEYVLMTVECPCR